MVEALGVTIDRHPKARPRKNEKLNHRKNRMCQYLNKEYIFVNFMLL